MLAFAGLIYNFWHDNQHPNLETSTVLHHAESFIFLNSKAHGTVHFQSRQLFLFNCRRERQLWVASKSFVHLSDSQILTLPFRLVRNVCAFEGMTEIFSRHPKAREKQKFCTFQGMQGKRSTAKGAWTIRLTKARFGADRLRLA